MATKVKVKMVPGARRKIRYLDSTASMLEGHGRRVMNAANAMLGSSSDYTPGFRMSSQPGRRRPYGRWRVSVAAVSTHAKRADRKRNILVRALG